MEAVQDIYQVDENQDEISSLFEPEENENKLEFTLYEPEDEEDSEVLETDDEDVAFFLKEGYFPKHSKNDWKELDRRTHNPDFDKRDKHQKGNNDVDREEGKDVVAEWRRRNEEVFSDTEQKDTLDTVADEEMVALNYEEDVAMNLSHALYNLDYLYEKESDKPKEHILRILTREDIERARREKYFGQERRRV